MILRAGALLVAEPAMMDPNFRHAVVLICQHDDEGTFGLILNRPTTVPLTQVLDETPGLDHCLFLGGPVQPETLHFLHGFGEAFEHAVPVAPGVAWGGPFDTVAEQLRLGLLDASRVRFFAGYAGWSADQLAEEVAEGSWRLVPASAGHVFTREAERLWRDLVLEQDDWALLVNYPEEPRLN